jgi:hypothetical protein
MELKLQLFLKNYVNSLNIINGKLMRSRFGKGLYTEH